MLGAAATASTPLTVGMPTSGGYDQRVVDTVKPPARPRACADRRDRRQGDEIASLNRGPDYARRIAINIERASPASADSVVRTLCRRRCPGAAECYLFQNDRAIDGMRVIVGAPETTTPMIAVLMRNAKANPY